MSIDDYTEPGANTRDLVEPFRSRVAAMCEHFRGRLTIDSGYRSFAEQTALWNRYGPPRAAKPGTSNHERGAAVDFSLNAGLRWPEVHDEAPRRGLCFPLAYEDWHCEADPAWVPPAPTEDDVFDKEAYAQAIGATIAPPDDEFAGMVCIPLLNDKGDGTKLYPFATAVGYTHQELKMARLNRGG